MVPLTITSALGAARRSDSRKRAERAERASLARVQRGERRARR
jgi:hypothetical protein